MSTASIGFAQPAAITTTYEVSQVMHLDETQLAVYLLDEGTGTWVGLPSTVDTGQQEVTAQTTQVGHYDVQAPLLCPADTWEINDTFNSAKLISTDNFSTTLVFDVAEDEDWFKFSATTGVTYTFQITGQVSGVATTMTLYETDGFTPLVSGAATFLETKVPQNGTYFLRIDRATGGTTGCDATYHLVATQEDAHSRVYLPLVLRGYP